MEHVFKFLGAQGEMGVIRGLRQVSRDFGDMGGKELFAQLVFSTSSEGQRNTKRMEWRKYKFLQLVARRKGLTKWVKSVVLEVGLSTEAWLGNATMARVMASVARGGALRAVTMACADDVPGQAGGFDYTVWPYVKDIEEMTIINFTGLSHRALGSMKNISKLTLVGAFLGRSSPFSADMDLEGLMGQDFWTEDNDRDVEMTNGDVDTVQQVKKEEEADEVGGIGESARYEGPSRVKKLVYCRDSGKDLEYHGPKGDEITELFDFRGIEEAEILVGASEDLTIVRVVIQSSWRTLRLLQIRGSSKTWTSREIFETMSRVHREMAFTGDRMVLERLRLVVVVNGLNDNGVDALEGVAKVVGGARGSSGMVVEIVVQMEGVESVKRAMAMRWEVLDEALIMVGGNVERTKAKIIFEGDLGLEQRGNRRALRRVLGKEGNNEGSRQFKGGMEGTIMERLLPASSREDRIRLEWQWKVQ